MARSQRSRRKQPQGSGGGNKRPRPSMDLGALVAHGGDDGDEHIDSSDSEDELGGKAFRRDEPSLESDEEDNEPLEAKKVRLAREYLEKVDAGASDDEESSSGSSAQSEEDENDDADRDERVSRKLQRQRQKKEGTLERRVADKVQQHLSTNDVEVRYLPRGGGHDLTPTCVALCGSDGVRAVSGSKDHSVVLWDLERQVKIATLWPHWNKAENNKNNNQTKKHQNHFRTAGQVLSVACSDDGRYAAVGRRDATVQIFDVRAKADGRNNNLVKTFKGGHKGPVTCLAFRSHSLQLFSGSSDRCIRHYNLDEMLYLETLYGHQFGVSDIDCHKNERPVSVGEDRTARAWKLTEDTHLIFRGGARMQSADCVTVVRDDWFLTGHQDGNLALWMTDKKKAVKSIEHAHGVDPASGTGRTVASVASLKMSDVAATGSSDGYLRFWKVRTGQTLSERGVERLCEVPLRGYVNSIAFGPKAKFCVVAVGQEHRLGRWNRVAGAKNRIAIVKLRHDDDLNDDADDDADDDASTNEEDFLQQQVEGGKPDGADSSSSASEDGESESE